MRLIDILLGRTRPVKPRVEKLFALSTSRITIAEKFDANPTGNAGICFKPVETSYFGFAESDLKQLLDLTGRETGSKVYTAKDNYGFRWILLADSEFEDLVATAHVVSQTLQERGFGEQMLAAVFEFSDGERHKIYWIYSYKRGNFYPFVPLPNRQRDNAYELRLRAVLEKELPVEPELERWYPIWDIPLGQTS
jgi:PspAB-like protein